MDRPRHEGICSKYIKIVLSTIRFVEIYLNVPKILIILPLQNLFVHNITEFVLKKNDHIYVDILNLSQF